jgi:uncharacterized repeat protein (TIGR04138 family)
MAEAARDLPEDPALLPDGCTMTHQPEKTLEQIVAETARYPLDGFVFIQDCIGTAADTVHGPPSPHMERLAEYMNREGLNPDDLRRLVEDRALPAKLAAIVEDLGGAEKLNRHVTGQQLCWAIRDVAQQRWGLLARTVLARWSITGTEDIGAIVFALVNNGWLQKQPTDSLSDFDAVFDFHEAFDRSYDFKGHTTRAGHAPS